MVYPGAMEAEVEAIVIDCVLGCLVELLQLIYSVGIQ
jgi:hypothetical protein